MPFWLAACWKNPFSAPLSPVHVKPARYISNGTLLRVLMSVCGGRKRLKAISQLVVEALWVHLRSLPPKDAMVAFVVTVIVQSIRFTWEDTQYKVSIEFEIRFTNQNAMSKCL